MFRCCGCGGAEFAAQCIQCRLKVVGSHVGQVLEDVGGVFGGKVELCGKVGAAFFVHFAAVCAEGGDVAGQGVAGFEQGKAGLQAVGEFCGFAAHVGKGAAEGGGVFVGAAAGDAVFYVVAGFAGFEAFGNFLEVCAAAAYGKGGGAFERKVFPVWPQVADRRPGKGCADNGVDDAHGHGGVYVQTCEGKAGQCLNGDEEGGKTVFVGAGHEEQGGTGDDDPEFGFDGEGEVGDERADDYAEYGAGDALVHAAFGGGVVGLADEKGGQQYPVAEVKVEGFDDGAGGGNDEGQADGMAEYA